MSAVTPKAGNHDQLPPLASRFVTVAALPWEKTRFPGVEAKTLLVDRETGLVTSLMKFAPNAKLPEHEHMLIEQTYVLEGSRHVAWCPQGGLMLAIFQVPNKFFEADGRVTDSTGKDWQAAWGHALAG